MNKVLILNSSAKPINIDGRHIAPGGQSVFERSVVPAAYLKKYAQGEEGKKPAETDDNEAETDVIERLQLKTVAVIEQKLAELSVDDLQRLKNLEDQSDSPRKGVLEAVSAELLNRHDDDDQPVGLLVLAGGTLVSDWVKQVLKG